MVESKRRLIHYKAMPGFSVKTIASELHALRACIVHIKASEEPLELDLALRLMDAVQGTKYAEVKVILKKTKGLTFDYARKRLHCVDWKKRILQWGRLA